MKTGSHRRDRLLQRLGTRLIRVSHNPNGSLDVFVDHAGTTVLTQFIKQPVVHAK